MAREGMVAARIENVLICAGECTVTVLPQFGGKIASIRIHDRELLQEPLAAIATRTHTMGFDQSDASGWDECLPSVGACRVETDGGVAEIPDHGDLWRVEWEKQGVERRGPGTRDQGRERDDKSGTSLSLMGKCFSLPLELERRIELSETTTGWRLQLDYKLRNTGRSAVPWSWAAHPLFAVEKGDRIFLPQSIRSLRVEGSGGERLGKGGDIVAWPIADIAGGGSADMSVVEEEDSGIGDKLFGGPLCESENWCALQRPSAGVRIRVTFDPIATPYLGLWICYGGWPERQGPKQVCVAMEPSTAPVDSVAVAGPWSRKIAPGESFAWPMIVEIERIER
jgi:galactose mutarotase-like enzyme